MEEIKQQVEEKIVLVNRIREEIGKVLVGQRDLIDGLLMGLFTKGHILIEGVPGLAKTSAVNTLAATVQADFKRIQFTPDLLPADLVGTEVFRPKTADFVIKKALSSIISFWRMRSTGLPPRFSRPCWRPCRSVR